MTITGKQDTFSRRRFVHRSAELAVAALPGLAESVGYVRGALATI
jgi:hypothetical protein